MFNRTLDQEDSAPGRQTQAGLLGRLATGRKQGSVKRCKNQKNKAKKGLEEEKYLGKPICQRVAVQIRWKCPLWIDTIYETKKKWGTLHRLGGEVFDKK